MNCKFKRFVAFAASLIIIAASAIFPMSLAAMGVNAEYCTGKSDIACVCFVNAAPVSLRDVRLYPGGMPFGVKFYTEGVMVVGFCDIETENGRINPAYAAGIRLKDIIIAVNGEALGDAVSLTSRIENSEGAPVDITYIRDGNEHTVTLSPVYSDSEARYKTGIWVRDSGAGIGTVTFIEPSSGAFGGLGHGICDSDTGELIPMRRGNVTTVTISGLCKGIAGDPGEIKGYFNSGKCGTLLGNTVNGVYGVFTEIPHLTVSEEPLEVAGRNEIKEGRAHIWCTLDTGEPCRYEIEISAVRREETSNKCFTVTVTDPALIEKTGGIIQGMSGSPIIQNGKLVGAVTHVLINDPTRGYGIFIENMLNNMPELLK